jgi:antitoxin component YwqK of YwqJK toxin-antitoxin module
MRNGQGKFYKNGELQYEGEFKNDMYNGKGKYYNDGQLTHEGLWVNNTFIK